MNTVQFKLLSTFASVIVLLCCLIGGAIVLARQAGGELRHTSTTVMSELEKLGQLESAALRRAVNVRDLSINEDMKVQAALIKESKELEEKTKNLLAELKVNSTSAQETEIINRLESSSTKVQATLVQVSNAIDEARFDDVKPLVLEKVRPQQQELMVLLRDVVTQKMNQAHERSNTTTQSIDQSILFVLLASLAVAFGAVFLAWRVSRSIIEQLGGEPSDAVMTAKAIQSGDLTTQFVVRAGGESSLMHALNDMQSSLVDVVGRVRQTADSVNQASAEIAQGNQDLSARTEKQAGALQEAAMSMDELATTVRHTAENASQANHLAIKASQVASEGGQVVQNVVQTMREISESSRKIADIIGVIDGIAFQTNILALNAAVEAARAGEQGRGFAVVASEVRSLAGRSAGAAKEIKSLITTSVERVEQGSQMVNRAGSTMNEVVVAIQQVAEIMGEISTATQAQNSGVSQVTLAVSHMDKDTQQNSALVEQSAAAAESLRVQSEQLVSAVAVFRLGYAPVPSLSYMP